MKTVTIQKPKRAHADRSDGIEWTREMVATGRARRRDRTSRSRNETAAAAGQEETLIVDLNPTRRQL